jgi:hypothetical protein
LIADLRLLIQYRTRHDPIKAVKNKEDGAAVVQYQRFWKNADLWKHFTAEMRNGPFSAANGRG